MSRNPRSTTPCRPPPSRPTTAESGAGATAVAGARGGACLGGRVPRPVGKSSIPKRGPPPAPPKKVDYKRPQMTRAMVQRLKHTQKLQEEQERRERERAPGCQVRRPRRVPPPSQMGPERDCPPRMSRERRPAPADPCDRRRPASAKASGNPCAESGPMPAGPVCPPPEPVLSRGCPPRSAGAPPPCPPEHPIHPDQQHQQHQQQQQQQQEVPAHTLNLAKSMNADIVQAEPLQRGLIDNLIIPPGAINSDKTTIVSIPQPEPGPAASSTLAPAPPSACHNQAANRSVQLISETLDEQDATEAAIVNNKLQDLQQARRDFVMAVATVGTNAINLMDEEPPANFGDITPIADMSPPDMMESQNPYLLPCRDPDTDPYLQPIYGRHHPAVESARDYMRSRGVDRYNPPPPLDDDLFLDDDAPELCPPFTRIPPRRSPQRYQAPEALEIDRLERFFDLQHYPPDCPQTPPSSQHCPGPPLGRENLPPDLWDIEDPWYKEADCPDLIDWRSYN